MKAGEWDRSESCIFIWEAERKGYDLTITNREHTNEYEWIVKLWSGKPGNPIYIIIGSGISKSWDDAQSEINRILDN